MKSCTVCKIAKELHEFDKRRNSSGEQVPTGRCKDCRKIYMNAHNRRKPHKTGLNREDFLKSVRKPKLSSDEKQALGKAKWDAWYGEVLREQEQKRKDLLAKGVKTCTGCNTEQPLSQYPMRTRKRTNGSTYKVYRSQCRTCRNNRAALFRASQEGQATAKAYRKSPAGKARAKKQRALRMKRSRQATPKWLTPEQRKQIVDIYEHMRDCRVVTGEDYHVDHIVPLRGENVCGLHVPWNLQVLPADVNISKSHYYEDPP